MARHATKSDCIKRLFRFIFFRLKYRLRTEEKESCMWFLRKVGKCRTKRSLLDSACSRLKDAELYTPWCNQFLRLLWDLPFPACSKREMHTEIGKSGNLLNKSRFCGLQVVWFECSSVMHPLVSSTLGVHCGPSLSLHAVNGICCMCHVNKVEIYCPKNRFCGLQVVKFECRRVIHRGPLLVPKYWYLGVFYFSDSLSALPFPACSKRKLQHVAC